VKETTTSPVITGTALAVPAGAPLKEYAASAVLERGQTCHKICCGVCIRVAKHAEMYWQNAIFSGKL